ncbi:AEC family transporter [candidate division WOR-3 bacterium]|nr:AEC family transporter [candidate division WOR-3 bacterium]
MFNDIITGMVPYIAAFVLGFAGNKFGLVSEKNGQALLRIYFYFVFPFLVFRILHSVEIEQNQVILPFIASFILFTMFALSLFISKKITKDKRKKVSFILAVSIMNTGFLMPFIREFTGEKGLSSCMIFDIGNMAVIATFLFAFSSYHASGSFKDTLKNLMLSPPVWAVAVSAAVNVLGYDPPKVLLETAEFLEKPAFPMILFALGSLLDFKIADLKTVLMSVFLRMAVGGILGLIIVSVIKLPPTEKFVVLLASSSPCGFNSVVYASLHGHDIKNASGAVSLSLIASILALPLIIFFALK